MLHLALFSTAIWKVLVPSKILDNMTSVEVQIEALDALGEAEWDGFVISFQTFDTNSIPY